MEQVYVVALLIRLAVLIYATIVFLKSDKTRGDYFKLGIATFIMALCSGICMSYNLMKASDYHFIMNASSIVIWSCLSLYNFYQAAFSPDFNNVPNNVPLTATKNSPPPPITLPKND